MDAVSPGGQSSTKMAVISFPMFDNDTSVEIIVQINRTSHSNHDLMSCLLVNRHWSASTAPIIYGNIALMNSSLGSIAQ
jgi:hypothetical protein